MLADGFPAVCLFVNDLCDAEVLEILAAGGTRLVALRCAGFNNVDLAAAADLGIPVVRVPAYSPHAVAEFTVGLILTLNRQIHRAYNRTRENNFALDGLLGFDLVRQDRGRDRHRQDRRLGRELPAAGLRLRGAGPRHRREPRARSIGRALPAAGRARGARRHPHPPLPADPGRPGIWSAPRLLELVKPGVMLVNTSRGALVDVEAVVEGLKSGRIGYLAIDVYEQEADLFFQDLSNEIIQDDAFQRLLTFPNVLVTGHQAFFTHEAMTAIADTTLANIAAFERGETLENAVGAELVMPR